MNGGHRFKPFKSFMTIEFKKKNTKHPQGADKPGGADTPLFQKISRWGWQPGLPLIPSGFYGLLVEKFGTEIFILPRDVTNHGFPFSLHFFLTVLYEIFRFGLMDERETHEMANYTN